MSLVSQLPSAPPPLLSMLPKVDASEAPGLVSPCSSALSSGSVSFVADSGSKHSELADHKAIPLPFSSACFALAGGWLALSDGPLSSVSLCLSLCAKKPSKRCLDGICAS